MCLDLLNTSRKKGEIIAFIGSLKHSAELSAASHKWIIFKLCGTKWYTSIPAGRHHCKSLLSSGTTRYTHFDFLQVENIFWVSLCFVFLTWTAMVHLKVLSPNCGLQPWKTLTFIVSFISLCDNFIGTKNLKCFFFFFIFYALLMGFHY